MNENVNASEKKVFLSYGQWEERFLSADYNEAKKRRVEQDISKVSETLADKAINQVMQLKHQAC